MARGRPDSAITTFTKAGEFYAASGQRERYFHCLEGIVDCYLRKMEMQKADSLLGHLLKTIPAELGEKHRVAAEAYRLAGYLRSYQDRYEEALDYNAKGLAIWKELFPDDLLTQSYYEFGIGLTRFRMGDLTIAHDRLTRAAGLQQATDPPAQMALVSTLIALGETEEMQGSFPSAVTRFKDALTRLDTLGLDESSIACTARHFIANTLRSMGDMQGGMRWELSALDIARKLYRENPVNLGSTLEQVGDYCIMEGDFEAARAYLDEAHAILTGVLGADHSSVRNAERKLARLFLLEGKTDTAALLYERVLRTQTASFGPNNPSVAPLYAEAGEARLAAGDAPGARTLFKRALQLLPPSDGSRRAEILLLLGNACVAMGQYEDGELAIRDALSRIDSTGSDQGNLRSALYEGLGFVKEKQGRNEDALKHFDRALDELTAAQAPPEQTATTFMDYSPDARPHAIQLLVHRGRAIGADARTGTRREERLRDALSNYENAGALLVRSRSWFRAEGSKLAAQQQLATVCGEGLALARELLVRTSDEAYRAKAFNFVELSRAGVLLEELEGAPHGTRHDGGDTSIAAFRSRAFTLSRLIEWTARYGEKDQLRALRNDLVRVYDAINAYEDAHRDEPGSVGRTVSLKVAQDQLDGQSCLLLYARAGDSLLAFSITKERSTLASLGPWGRAESLAAAMRISLRTLDRRRYSAAAQALYRILLRPLASDIRAFRHLIIAPYGSLNYVPFEALIEPGKPAGRSPQYVVLSHDISYTPSATVYALGAGETGAKAPHETKFEGFAPVFGLGNAAGTARQRQYLARLDPMATRSISVDGKEFNALPYSLDEIRNISGMYAARGREALCISEEEATEESFKANAGKAEVLHVATHGFINEEHPALSALIFAPARGESSAEDGVLYAGEVYDMHLHAGLVVLSSCESGVGKMAAGEGVLGMSRAFVAAGAKAVTYSLWKVNDRQTGVLMVEFYRNILAGKSHAAALAAAKRTMIKSRSGANPYFWAGFVLTGR